MLVPVHPEVLAPDWIPPVPIARRAEARSLEEALRAGLAQGAPRLIALRGPAGSGTSTVARWAAKAVAGSSNPSPASAPRRIAVRVRSSRGAWGVATALLGQLDPTFTGRGFHPSEIIAGFLRRLQREGAPTIVVLDDVGPGSGDLGLVVRALTEPERFLPEGGTMPGRLVSVVAGVPEAAAVWAAVDRQPRAAVRRLDLGPYPPEVVATILADRAARALGRDAPEAWLGELTRRVRDRGYSATTGLELLRRALGAGDPPLVVAAPGGRSPEFTVEPRLLSALQRLAAHRRASIAQIRRWEAEFAAEEGGRPLPATTFWRRIVRLESVGLVHRDVRAGGSGGTRSIVELVQPLPEWLTTPETRPTGEWLAVPRGPAEEAG